MIYNLTLYPFIKRSRVFTHMEMKALENIIEKGENGGNKHDFIFPQCFLRPPTKALYLRGVLYWSYSVYDFFQ